MKKLDARTIFSFFFSFHIYLLLITQPLRLLFPSHYTKKKNRKEKKRKESEESGRRESVYLQNQIEEQRASKIKRENREKKEEESKRNREKEELIRSLRGVYPRSVAQPEALLLTLFFTSASCYMHTSSERWETNVALSMFRAGVSSFTSCAFILYCVFLIGPIICDHRTRCTKHRTNSFFPLPLPYPLSFFLLGPKARKSKRARNDPNNTSAQAFVNIYASASRAPCRHLREHLNGRNFLYVR